jgi:hypothetical protein
MKVLTPEILAAPQFWRYLDEQRGGRAALLPATFNDMCEELRQLYGTDPRWLDSGLEKQVGARDMAWPALRGTLERSLLIRPASPGCRAL